MLKSLIKGVFSGTILFSISTFLLVFFKMEGSMYNMFLLSISLAVGIYVSLKDYLNKPLLATAQTKDNWKTYEVKLSRR